jgi:hypothetical protein
MAKVIMSAAVGAASGKLGGTVFSKGSAGAFMLRKTNPVNSKSPTQLAIRGNFATLTKRWAHTLTAVQQAGWIAFAAAHQLHDALGNLFTATGIQMYVKLNGALKAVGQATIDTAPGAVSAGAPGVITVTAKQAGPPTLSVAVTSAPGVNDTPAIWSMHPTTIGRKSVKAQLSIIKVFAPGTAGPYDILAEWNLKFGLLLTGSIIVCQVQYTDSTTGWLGTASIANALTS